MSRHEKHLSEIWMTLPWKKFQRVVNRLQRRLFKAVKAGDKRKVSKLQRLLLKSRSARFLAIRQVTQLNIGKKTAGVDGKKSLDHEARFELEELLKLKASDWKHQGLRRIPIPKKDRSTRWLKVPTIADRAWQKLVHYALDAAHEATFAANSFGFRPGRSAHDAQKTIFQNLNSSKNGKDKIIFEMDIAGCFDNISHTKLMDAIMLPQAFKTGVFRCLKAGLDVRFNDDTEHGTPQGGIISPTLANIALNDLDNLPIFTKDKYKSKVRLIRYADDMIAIIKPGVTKENVKKIIERELQKWGLELKESKTRFSSPTDGFDFLGWHFSVQANNGKFRSSPSKDNYRKFRKKVKDIVNCSNLSTDAKAKKLSSIIRGWREYHKYCDMTNHSLWHLNHATWKKFRKDKNSSRKKANELISMAFPTVDVKQNGHSPVQGIRSPYDGNIVYWTERNSKHYNGMTSIVLKKQDYRCGRCGLKLNGDERVHLHHSDGNHGNWKIKNLTTLHKSCHDYIHMGKRKGK